MSTVCPHGLEKHDFLSVAMCKLRDIKKLFMKELSRFTRFWSLIILLLAFTLKAQAQKDLDFYINQAWQKSPLLKEAGNLVRSGRIDSLRLKAGQGIQASAISNSMFAPVIRGWGYDNTLTDGTNVNALVSLSKELNGRRNRQNRFESFSIQNQYLQNSSKITEQELKKNISELYITAFGSWQQYNFNLEMLIFLNKESEILKQLTQKGSVRQTDYLSFTVNLQQQELQVEQAKNRYRNDFALLNYSCGMEDTSFTILVDPNLKVENIPDLPGTIFFRQFLLDSLKLENADKQIDFSYQPKISLMADGGYLSTLANHPWKNFGVSAGVSVSIPIYDGGQRRMQHDQIAISQQTRTDYLDFYVSQFRQQTSLLHQQLKTRQTLGQKIIRQIETSKSVVDAFQRLLDTGDVQMTEYLLSLANYLSAKNMLIENNIEKYLIINELNYWNRTK
jgi:outer membrane protein TolC